MKANRTRLARLEGSPELGPAVQWIRVEYVDVPSANYAPPRRAKAATLTKANAHTRGSGPLRGHDLGSWERREDEAEAAFVARVERDVRRHKIRGQAFVVAYTD